MSEVSESPSVDHKSPHDKEEKYREFWQTRRKRQKELRNSPLVDAASKPKKNRGFRSCSWSHLPFEQIPFQLPKVVIDLSFISPLRLNQDGETLSTKDIRHVVRQINFSYGAIRKSERPLQIHLTSLTCDLLPFFEKYSGFSNWPLVKHEQSYLDIFERDKLVYLSPDAEQVLADEIDPHLIYIIGGLDDHNKQKNASLFRAEKDGICTRRLPIAKATQGLKTDSKSLTVNQVVEALQRFSETRDWETVFSESFLPRRKAYMSRSARDHDLEDIKDSKVLFIARERHLSDDACGNLSQNSGLLKVPPPSPSPSPSLSSSPSPSPSLSSS